jgi:hypothetical protein
MMFEWQAARFRASAGQFLSGVFTHRSHFVGFIAGNFFIAKDTTFALNKWGLLRNGVATDKKLLGTFQVAGDFPLLTKDDLVDVKALGGKLSNPGDKDEVSKFLKGRMLPEALQDSTAAEKRRAAFVEDLNEVLKGPSIYDPQRFADVNLSPATKSLMSLDPKGYELIRLNRLLLDDAYPKEIANSRPGELDKEHAEFQRLYKSEEIPGKGHGDWQVQGYAMLPGSQRPADAIVLAYRVPGGEWIMFGLTQAYGAPKYLGRSMGKDLYSMIPSRDTWPKRVMYGWDPDVHFEETPPPNALITAWAVDMARHRIFRITRPLKAKTDSADGETLEALARDVPHDDDDVK